MKLLEMLIGLFLVMFLMSIQPIMMVVSLIFITFFYSLYIYMMMGGYWFSYVLLMVMLSGVMVVFTYMVSLIPNESFEMNSLVILFVLMFMMLIKGFMLYGEDVSFISLNLWVSWISVFNLFLVSFLLGIMVMVVWVSNSGEGAMRV